MSREPKGTRPNRVQMEALLILLKADLYKKMEEHQYKQHRWDDGRDVQCLNEFGHEQLQQQLDWFAWLEWFIHDEMNETGAFDNPDGMSTEELIADFEKAAADGEPIGFQRDPIDDVEAYRG